MNFLKRLLPIVLSCGFATNAFATSQDIDERDIQAIRDFIKTKRSITVEEKGGNLGISGEVRTEWQYLCEKEDGLHLRGSKALNLADSETGNFVPVPTHEFDIEANLYIDYKCDRTWAFVHLEFDNNSGIPKRYCGSGICHDICLFAAYFGYSICETGCSQLDIEFGRRPLYDVYDSRVQFNSRFDGITLSYYNCYECTFEFFAKGSVFVVNENEDHYGYVGEIGFLNIVDSKLGFKYSFISWNKDGPTCYEKDADGITKAEEWNYQISQVTALYQFCPEFLRSNVRLYAAWLYNHSPKDFTSRNGDFEVPSKERMAWYAGVTFGQLRYQGDWSVDVNYQHVEAQAVPDHDVSGIGRGNVKRENLQQHGRGNANYRGWLFEAAYAVTDNLTISTEAEFSDEILKTVGGKHDYGKYEIEIGYTF